ncbi:hypothetical protein [Clostridium formicaceticum]|uniref:Uncharacterized protein n=1 Tax=Clostridium formicaceticum TaxID=1497 RepID=A0AAC9RIZ6_9CLOT|nr:hypothetical protein [Clostridium formicaceticum]AOY76001.1 hypothetical protein BJL90_08880 [Clostridium formicaceticum]ARE86357.1 hypothetical protein CLFO_06790 [Clostridium formicaceticum]
MLAKKSIKATTVIFAVITIIVFGFIKTNTSLVQIGDRIAYNASKQLNESKIEYIKVSRKEGYSEEYYRDMKNLKERSDIKDENGNLVNRILVLEEGKRIINIGNENGKVEVHTWLLPDEIAKANKEILSKSIQENIKNSLKNQKWTLEGNIELSNGKKAKKISSLIDGFCEVVYVDEETDFPIKREIYEVQEDGGKKLKLIEERAEEYKKIDDDSNQLFEYEQYELEEIPAPVEGNEVGKG